MEQEAPFRLVRDALGFYSQVPIEVPLEVPIADVVHECVASVCEPVKRKGGRPKKHLNAEFEV